MPAILAGAVANAPKSLAPLRCTRCGMNLTALDCPRCAFRMNVIDGIVHTLSPEREEHYAKFLEDYTRIRIAEGRGSEVDDFYLELPYRDLSGRNIRQWQIRARSFDYLMTHLLHRPVLKDGRRILDVGAGNCWMSFRLALAGCKPVAVDVNADERDGLRAANHYRKLLPELFPRYRAEMTRLPFEDRQFDAIVFNASFHYSEDYEATLAEALRCTKRDGLVIIVDTPWYSAMESGVQMVAERRAAFLKQYATSSDAIEHLEYLTDERLRNLAEALSIHWEIHSPYYGFRWALRPVIARLRRRREPSRFRIYAARNES
jgi:ubiquinone/menaquinone biosynthesis C-methylase UbiE